MCYWKCETEQDYAAFVANELFYISSFSVTAKRPHTTQSYRYGDRHRSPERSISAPVVNRRVRSAGPHSVSRTQIKPLSSHLDISRNKPPGSAAVSSRVTSGISRKGDDSCLKTKLTAWQTKSPVSTTVWRWFFVSCVNEWVISPVNIWGDTWCAHNTLILR